MKNHKNGATVGLAEADHGDTFIPMAMTPEEMRDEIDRVMAIEEEERVLAREAEAERARLIRDGGEYGYYGYGYGVHYE